MVTSEAVEVTKNKNVSLVEITCGHNHDLDIQNPFIWTYSCENICMPPPKKFHIYRFSSSGYIPLELVH